jgi:hypothetical protein
MGLADDDVPCAVISGVGDLAVRVFEGHIVYHHRRAAGARNHSGDVPGVGRGHEHHDLACGDLRLPVALLAGRPVVGDDPFAAGRARDAEYRAGNRQ